MCSEPARMPAKYYIYAGGRWCEVDTQRGRVSGWRQRARFCFLRGGRLEVARTARVLRALRVLATGVGGAAKDAAPLQHRRPHRLRRESVRTHHHCCSSRLHHSRCDFLPASTPLKRKRSTSGEAASKAKQSKSNKTGAKTVKQDKTSPQNLKTVRVRNKQEENIDHSLLENSSSDDKEEKLSQKSNTSAKIRSPEEEELVQSLLQSSSEDTRRKNLKTQSKTVKGKHKECILLSSSSEDTFKKNLKSPSQNKTVKGKDKKPVQTVLPSSLQEKKKKPSQQEVENKKTKSPQNNVKTRGKDIEKIVQSLLHSSSSEDNVNEQAKRKPESSSKKNTDDGSSSVSTIERDAPCKELIIDDGDVTVLRKFLERGADGTDLERFDNDEEYKTSVFYKLNPLVVLDRCGPLEKLLRLRLTLKEFARHLGLRSVADVTPEKRYRMRHTTRQARRVTSDSETDKENVIKPKRRQLWNRDKELFNSRSSRSSDVRERPHILKPARDISRESNDSDTEIKQHIQKHLKRRNSAVTPAIPRKTASKKEVDDSVVISNTTSTDSETDVSDDDQGKSRNKNNDSIVVSDEMDSDINFKPGTRRTRANIAKKDESVVVSDESSDDQMKSRRTRSKGTERRVLRDNTTAVDTDSSITSNDEKRDRSKINSKDLSAKAKSKIVIVSEGSNTDEKQGSNKRTRSTGPDRALKEQNRSVNNTKKHTNTKTNKEVERSTESRTTRSSMKGADHDTKDKYKESSKNIKAKVTSFKSNEDKLSPAKKEPNKVSKIAEAAPIVREDTVSSDSDSAFETSKLSPTKKLSKLVKQQGQRAKGRLFFKKEGTDKEDNSNANTNEKQRRTDEKIRREKNEITSKETHEKANDKLRGRDNEKQSKDKSKANEKLREREKAENKGTDNSKTGNENKNRNEMPSAVVRNMFKKPVKVKKSCVANGREYTSLEDHAIVAWVSIGSRERMVNGNAIWRELQSEYPRLTSQTRSWHSLRNRYLRYILPSLGSLALPPAQVSRLRAAAAVGKIKSRVNNRRNSIFSAPSVRSAAVAGRARPRADTEQENKRERTPPSPRRARPPAALSPSKTPSPSKTLSPAKRIPSPTPAPRLRAKPSAASTPTPKKRRIHHL